MNAPADRGECFDPLTNQRDEEGLRTMRHGRMEETNLSPRPLQLEDRDTGVFVTPEEINERKREEGALSESELRLRRDIEALLQNVGVIIWQGEADIHANTFHLDFVSQQAERLLGYPVNDWLQNPPIWIEHIHQKDRRRVLAMRNQALARQRDYEIEYRMIARDGQTIWLREIVKVELANEHQLKLRGIAIDIT